MKESTENESIGNCTVCDKDIHYEESHFGLTLCKQVRTFRAGMADHTECDLQLELLFCKECGEKVDVDDDYNG